MNQLPWSEKFSLPKPSKRTNFIIDAGNQDSLAEMPILQAVLHCESKHYGIKDYSVLKSEHAIAHLIGAGLARDGLLMNYARAEHDKPLYQAGLQSEFMGDLYSQFCFKDQSTIDTGDTSDQGIKTMARDFLRKEEMEQEKDIKNTLIMLDDSKHTYGHTKHYKHAKHYIDYLTNAGILTNVSVGNIYILFELNSKKMWKPNIEEVAFHIRKALKIREKIEEWFDKHTNEERNIDTIMKMPLSTIMIDNTSKEDIAEREERARLRKEFYGAKTVGHDLINDKPSERHK